jgi:uncharacterized protein YbbC (DUF1343 family)
VYDIQDVGVRYYTYITTMAYAMEAAAAAGLEFFVLDRPNPITAALVQGPVLDRNLKSFIGYYPLPVRYGMTPGELAQLFNREAGIGVRLQVVPMKGYRPHGLVRRNRPALGEPLPEPQEPEPINPLQRRGHGGIGQRQRRPGHGHAL